MAKHSTKSRKSGTRKQHRKGCRGSKDEQGKPYLGFIKFRDGTRRCYNNSTKKVKKYQGCNGRTLYENGRTGKFYYKTSYKNRKTGKWMTHRTYCKGKRTPLF